jgi:dolichol-phosphate mannosyltransferase
MWVKQGWAVKVQRMRVLIIIPTYNERDNIEPLVAQIHGALPVADVLIVDDNSPDGTGQLADELAKKDPKLTVLHRPGKLGLGTAYLTGFRHALSVGYDYVFEMDADFSHDPCYLPALLDAATGDEGADLIIGSRRIPGGGTENWGLGRQLLSAGGSLYARAILGLGQTQHILGLPVNDLTSGFKCFRRRVLEALDLDSIHSEGYSFQIEVTYRALRRGFRVAEVPIVFIDRRAGQSKMSFRIFLEAMGVVWRLRLRDAWSW